MIARAETRRSLDTHPEKRRFRRDFKDEQVRSIPAKRTL
jgi:hypothetical protein